MMHNDAAARQFWKWFAEHEIRLKSLLDASRSEDLAALVIPQLRKYADGLGWEFGPGRTRPYMFSVSSVGERGLPTAAAFLVSLAPPMQGWEIFDSRQARESIGRFHLITENVWVHPETWKVVATENLDAKRIDIDVVAEEFETLSQKTKETAVLLALDMLLGDQAVEEWIGGIAMHTTHEEYEKLLPFSELKEHVSVQQERFGKMTGMK